LEKSGVEILRQYRAIGEKPGTYSHFRNDRLLLHNLRISSKFVLPAKSGSISFQSENLLVRCGDCWIEVGEVTPAGKKRMKSADFIRGARISDDEQFS